MWLLSHIVSCNLCSARRTQGKILDTIGERAPLQPSVFHGATGHCRRCKIQYCSARESVGWLVFWYGRIQVLRVSSTETHEYSITCDLVTCYTRGEHTSKHSTLSSYPSTTFRRSEPKSLSSGSDLHSPYAHAYAHTVALQYRERVFV